MEPCRQLSPEGIALVLRARRGDPSARAGLVDEWLPTVLGWCNRLGGPRVDPEDAAHDVLIVVLTRLHALRRAECFEPWLFGVTRRVLAKHRRMAWVRLRVPGPALDGFADPERPDPTTSLELSRAARAVRSTLERLPRAQREVLILCDAEGRSASEASAVLNIPVGTVKSRLRAGRERFRRHAERSAPLAALGPVSTEVPG